MAEGKSFVKQSGGIDGLVRRFVDSRWFFLGVVVVFALQAGWLAISGVYPLPFDEYYHFGIISIYADQWSPFIHSQPLEAGLYGDITRMPSYLYHYLMSFPYRLLAVFTHSEQVLIVGLRLLNVAMVVGAMWLFRKLLLESGISRRVAHIVVAIFAFTPIVSLLAAHINYDNLMLLLTPLVLMMAVRVIRGRGNLATLTIGIIALGLVTVLVKNSFAPLLALVAIYMVALVIIRYQGRLLMVYRESLSKASRSASFAALLFVAIIAGALFSERYIGNLVSHGRVNIRCEQVQDESTCAMNTVWMRNEQNRQNKPAELPYGPLEFTGYWTDRMLRGYFAIFSHNPARVVSDVEPYGPIELRPLLLAPLIAGLVLLSMGVVSVALQLRWLWRNPVTRFLTMVSLGYVAILFLFNVSTYLNVGKPEAIQARYTLPIIVPLLGVMALAVRNTWRSIRVPQVILLLMLVPFLIGGGIVGRLAWNPPGWIWPISHLISINSRTSELIRGTLVTEWRETVE